MSGSTSGTWYTWCSDETSATTTNATVWGSWCGSATTTGTTTGNVTCWQNWNGQVVQYIYQRAPETEEQKQARLQRREEERIAAEERAKQEAEALQRAEDLLMMQLAEKQKQDWRTKKAFEILSQSGKRFRIRNGSSMNIDELDDHGKVVANHCIISRERVPLPDQIVMQKLMLETMEADFMQIANHRQVQ